MIRFTIILTFICSLSLGQSTDPTQDILEIIKVGVSDKKLSAMLINNVDSIRSAMTKHHRRDTINGYPLTIGVEGTKENGLKPHERIKWGKVEIWVWGEEDFFLFNIYWITPSNIKIRGNRISFDYTTHTWGDKPVKYYKGTIKAEKVSDQWRVTKSSMSPTTNSFDAWMKAMRESNAH